MKHLFPLIAIILLCTACHSNNAQNDNAASFAQVQNDNAVPFTQAQNYFVRSDVSFPVPNRIDSRDQFDAIFGMAAVMGPEGQPTAIDFDTHFALSVVLPQTNYSCSFTDIQLLSSDTALTLHYTVLQDDTPNSFTQQPFLLLFVDRQYDRPTIHLSPKE